MHWLGNSIFDVKLAAVPLFLGFVILSSYTIWQFEAKKKSLFLTKIIFLLATLRLGCMVSLVRLSPVITVS